VTPSFLQNIGSNPPAASFARISANFEAALRSALKASSGLEIVFGPNSALYFPPFWTKP
jgi:hypothetical protein